MSSVEWEKLEINKHYLGEKDNFRMSFQRGDVYRHSTPASYAPPFRSQSGPPQNYPRHGYPPHQRSNPGTPLSSRDYNDPRRNSYDRNQAPRQNYGGYRGNQPTAWSHTMPGSWGRGSNQSQYSRGNYSNSSRDPRQHQHQQQQNNRGRDDRRHSYPLSNNRYRPY